MRAIFSQAHKALLEAGKARSPRWDAVRAAHLRREPFCRWCGGDHDLEVHHIHPFHDCPERELDPRNLITLCDARGRQCHLRVGHLGDWRGFNPVVRRLAKSPRPGEAAEGRSIP